MCVDIRAQFKLVSGFPQYLSGRKESINNMIESLKYAPDSVQSSRVTELQAELAQISNASKLKYPSPSFSFDKVFTENMRQSFTWGGDWYRWNQLDYMHFER